MQSSTKFYAPLPGNGSDFDPKDNIQDDEKIVDSDSLLSDSNEGQEEHSDNKGFKASLRDALQEWSNDDARDIEEDDSTP